MIPNILWGMFIAETLWNGIFNNILIVYTALILLIDYSIIHNIYFNFDEWMNENFWMDIPKEDHGYNKKS
jgi:hypothetical protein